jgi:hypothetical protein
MEVSRSVVIERAVDDVFAYVAEPRNDPRWCPKVLSVEQVDGHGPGAGSRYVVLHRPIPLRPARRMDHACLSWERPTRIAWREQDGGDVFMVIYTLEDLGRDTRLTQRTDAQLAVPRVLGPLMRAGIARDIARQFVRLKSELESARGPGADLAPHGNPSR